MQKSVRNTRRASFLRLAFQANQNIYLQETTFFQLILANGWLQALLLRFCGWKEMKWDVEINKVEFPT